MSRKMRDYEAGRADGLDLALRIVKDGGVEALEQEIKFRGVTGIHTSLAVKDLNRASEKIQTVALDMVSIVSLAALHDLWGFGEKRGLRFMQKLNQGFDYINKDLAHWDDYVKELSEQMNIKINIDWNDE